jgi:squalene/oxidosqualene cyclase-like protein
VEQSAIAGAEFFKHVQAKDGHIASDYGGPMFLMPGCVITCHATGTHLPAQTKLEMIKYICSHQQQDGGWGLHIESKSTMFGTVLNYVALRLLGVKPHLAPVEKARAWIRGNGGAQGIPSWGKFWLAVMNLMPWDGLNSIFPEMWLMPQFLPFYPGRFWCHCRMVYLPMAYVYGAKFQVPVTDIVTELRSELYLDAYDTMDFPQYRNTVCETDKYTEQAPLLKLANGFMNLYEKYMPFKSYFRKRAMAFILDYVSAEDDQTNYVDIGPVSKFVNMICCMHGYGKDSQQVRLHQARIADYLWVAEDGMKMQGYTGSQLWDTAFTVQAFTELEKGIVAYNSKFGEERTLKEQFEVSPLRPFYEQSYKFIEDTQIRDEVIDREKYFRHVSLGGWPFSTRDHGWPISDCTAEGLKAILALHATGLIPESTVVDPECGRPRYVDVKRMQDAIHVMLTLQNYDGGWATYENTRGPAWLEALNPSEVFGGIMIDYSYVECTSACVQALTKVKDFVPHDEHIDRAIQHGAEFIRDIQRPDGGWVGSWGVCFTYGAWFGMEGLRCAGFRYDTSVPMQKGCAFLLKHQNKDGGWGESFESCVTKEYCYSYNKNLVKNAEGEEADPNEPVSMVINTAWSMLALIEADYHLIDRSVLDRAARFILSRQLPNGDWPQEGISGVFNGNCMITYTAYRSIFPIWALGRYLSKVAETMQ